MTLTNSDIAELTAFRRDLHRHPELSGEESETARRVLAALGVDDVDAGCALRVSLGTDTTMDDVQGFADAWAKKRKKVRAA